MSEQSFNSMQEDEISLKDIVNFLFEFWKTIVFTGILGVLSSAAYLLITPSQYQGTAQIQMAQINISNNTNPLGTNPLGTNIEDPKLLLVRLRMPTTYSDTEIKACGLTGKRASPEVIANSIKLSEIRGVGAIIELKVNGPTREVVSACAEALFKNIQISQSEITNLYVNEAKTLLVKYQDRLNGAKSLIENGNKSVDLLSASYLASRDEVRFIVAEIFRLNTVIASGDSRRTKLISPIYIEDVLKFPKKVITLIMGLVIGLFLGLFLALVRRVYATYKASQSFQK